MDRLRNETFDPTEFPDTESYLWFLRSNAIRMTGMDCPLPDADVETRPRPCSAIWQGSVGCECWRSGDAGDTVFCLWQQYRFEQMARRCPAAQVVGPANTGKLRTGIPRKWISLPSCRKRGCRLDCGHHAAPRAGAGPLRGYPRHYTKELVAVRERMAGRLPSWCKAAAEEWSRHRRCRPKPITGIIQ